MKKENIHKTPQKIKKTVIEELKRQKSMFENLKWQLAERDRKVKFLEDCLHEIKDYRQLQFTPAYLHKEMKELKYGRRRRVREMIQEKGQIYLPKVQQNPERRERLKTKEDRQS